MKVVYKIYRENHCEFEYFTNGECRKIESDDTVLTLVYIDGKHEYETEEEAMLVLKDIVDIYDNMTFTILKCYTK